MPQLRRGLQALVIGGAMLAPVTSALAAPQRSPSLQELYLQNTQTGASMAGNLTFSYRSAGRLVRHSCPIYRCAYRVPSNAVVTLSQSPLNPNKYRFKTWRIQALGAAKAQVFKKPRVLVVMSTGYTATAVYTAVKH